MSLTNRAVVSAVVSGTDAVDTEYLTNLLGEVGRIESLTITPIVSVATHASNYITLTVKKGATTIATTTTNSSGGAAMTAGTPTTMTLTGTGTTLEIADGGVITIDVAKAGTGPAYEFRVSAVLRGIRQ